MSETPLDQPAGHGEHSGIEGLRARAHQILDRLPDEEIKAAVIALEELEVGVRVRTEGMEHVRGEGS